jgi:hypothetical protein
VPESITNCKGSSSDKLSFLEKFTYMPIWHFARGSQPVNEILSANDGEILICIFSPAFSRLPRLINLHKTAKKHKLLKEI